jgi:hypothetical protein
MLDAGYGFSAAHELALAAQGGGPARTADVELGDVALRGFTFRAAFALAY